ncbi:unnamed protein product [Microthlaspi erraticum]|uniref:Exportin-5 C-terminal domain-containing protein n=1 Tax=Microthlaspi erraticum TaxID=1685480 RepID=A0A6D2J3G0_9BRAS|nr:unnamed protein product [Microthlaspi erraticum]
MLGFFQHFKLGLHFEAMLFWLTLMRDLLSKPKAAVYPNGEGPAVGGVNEKKKILSLINDDISSAILDVLFNEGSRKKKSLLELLLLLGH